MDSIIFLKGLMEFDQNKPPVDLHKDLLDYLESLSYGERKAELLEKSMHEFIILRNVNEAEPGFIIPELRKILRKWKVEKNIPLFHKTFTKSLNSAEIKMECGYLARQCNLSKPMEA